MRKILSYFIILFILFKSSGSSDLSGSKEFLIGGWTFFTIAHIYCEKQIKYLFLKLIALFALISVVYLIKNGAYDGVTYWGFFMKVCLAYYCRDICKEDFSPFFVNVVFVAACISIPFFIVQLINFDFLYRINKLLGGIESISNSGVFTMVPIHEFRNCGFMWEPGAFAGVLTITLYLNTFKEGENLFSNKNKIFILAILTTQSTMGFLSLLIPICLVLKESIAQNKTLRRLSVLFVPALLIVFYAVFSNVKFLSEKIFNEIKDVDEELAFIEKGNKDNFVVAVTRTTSVLLDMETIKYYPILGLGVDMRTTSKNKLSTGENTKTACGLTVLLLRFGFVGLIIYAFLLYKNALFEESIHRIGWVFLWFFVLFSNDLSGGTLFHMFVF